MEVECVPCSEGEVSKPWRDLNVGRGVEVLERGAVRRHGCSYQSVKKNIKNKEQPVGRVLYMQKGRWWRSAENWLCSGSFGRRRRRDLLISRPAMMMLKCGGNDRLAILVGEPDSKRTTILAMRWVRLFWDKKLSALGRLNSFVLQSSAVSAFPFALRCRS